MWKRAELKQKAKYSFKRNYWKSILVSLLLALLAGGGGSGVGSSFAQGLVSDSDKEASVNEYNSDMYDWDDELDDSLNDGLNDELQLNDGLDDNVEDGDLEHLMETSAGVATVMVFIFVFMIVFVVTMAIFILLDVFIFNPLEVGCKRYYVRNLNEAAQIGNLGYAFDNNYKNITKTMFFRDLYTVLWTLLLIIPGIIKSYEYMMIPYLLAENPQMTKEQAFAESKRMMSGQKWRAFVLDLSFIGWNILSALTLGILRIFYVQPYMDATHAALYEALRYGNPNRFYNGMPQNGGFNNIPNGMNHGFTNSVPNSIVEENPQQ